MTDENKVTLDTPFGQMLLISWGEEASVRSGEDGVTIDGVTYSLYITLDHGDLGDGQTGWVVRHRTMYRKDGTYGNSRPTPAAGTAVTAQLVPVVVDFLQSEQGRELNAEGAKARWDRSMEILRRDLAEAEEQVSRIEEAMDRLGARPGSGAKSLLIRDVLGATDRRATYLAFHDDSTPDEELWGGVDLKEMAERGRDLVEIEGALPTEPEGVAEEFNLAPRHGLPMLDPEYVRWITRER